MSVRLPIELADIEIAAQRLATHIVTTPLLEFAALNERCGGRVLIKPEILQHTGSFKFRGAYNKLVSLSHEERARGVLAVSSGNHAQGVALAARLLDVKATVVMPEDAPPLKIRRTREFGADIVFYDRLRDDREKLAAELAQQTAAVLVNPFDDPFIMAGQGTLGLEIVEQSRALNVQPSMAFVPCGGGGLIAGVSTALCALIPGIKVHAVEPEGFDDTARSLAGGRRVTNRVNAGSICDSLLAPTPGELTFAIMRRRLARTIVVSDDEVRCAMRWAFENLKLVVEPGGIVGLAALLAGKADLNAGCAVIVLSGGNADPAQFAAILN